MCKGSDIRGFLNPIKKGFTNRKEAIVSVMSLAGAGEIFNPVQIQKILFLLDATAGNRNEVALFHFTPYKYGPFDQGVYHVLEELYENECVEILPGRAYKRYVLKPAGFEMAKNPVNALGKSKGGLEKLVKWILAQSFIELVKAIYEAFPDMKTNSVLN